MKNVPTPPLLQSVNDCFDWLDDQSLVPREPLIVAPPSPEFVLDGRKIISFSSNNYLGLSRRKEVLAAAVSALNKYTMGTCESRKLGGNIALLEALEARIASFKGVEAAMVFATGLLANVAVIPGLMDSEWYCNRFYGRKWNCNVGTIFSDERNHRSIQMGIRLSHARGLKYHHGDMDHLQELLAGDTSPRKLIVTDGLFSMDGDLAPLAEICRVAAKYQAAVMVDDAHGTGIFGKSGRGVAEHFAVEKNIQLHMGTLSKAVGAMGGFLAADYKTIEFLKSSASGYRFTSSLPAEQAAGIICAIDIMEQEPQLRQKLWQNVAHLFNGLRNLNIAPPKQWSPIVPLLLGTADKAFKAEKILMEHGVSCIAIIPPLVANTSSRLRITINATHTAAHIEQLLAGLKVVDQSVGLQNDQVDDKKWNDFLVTVPAYLNLAQSG